MSGREAEDEDRIPWLKRLPARLESGQRVLLEAIDISADLIQAEHARIIQVISALDGKNEIERPHRLSIFSSAWSIVDRMDAIRLILQNQRSEFDLELSPAENALLKAVRIMRNQMDHLGSNRKSFTSKSQAYPAYGLLSFNWYDDDGIELNERGTPMRIKSRMITLVSLSACHHKLSVSAAEMVDNNIYKDFGNLTLFAFDQRVRLNDACAFAERVRTILNESGERSLLAAAQDEIANGTLTRAELLEPVNEPFVIVVKQEFPNWWDLTPSPSTD